ncbi:hypothetical protein [Abyssibius alkaniclasticus]|uniref:hypothetical protein n=1 Tax=Abyssibius alkaniclasticus TaxID=2881234 RepID=UPI0040586752
MNGKNPIKVAVNGYGVIGKRLADAVGRGTLLRCATDPWESHLGGIVNTWCPNPKSPAIRAPMRKALTPIWM